MIQGRANARPPEAAAAQTSSAATATCAALQRANCAEDRAETMQAAHAQLNVKAAGVGRTVAALRSKATSRVEKLVDVVAVGWLRSTGGFASAVLVQGPSDATGERGEARPAVVALVLAGSRVVAATSHERTNVADAAGCGALAAAAQAYPLGRPADPQAIFQ